MPGPRPESGLTAALADAFRASGRPAPEILSLDALSGGSINRAYRLRTRDGNLFCKWNPDAPPGMFDREREGLEALAGSGASLVIPRVFAVSAAPGGAFVAPGGESVESGSAVLVLEYLAPEAGGSRRSTWEALGRGLAELHSRESDRFGFARDNYCGLTVQENAWSKDWAGFYGERRIGTMIRRIEAAGRAGAREMAVFRKLRARLPALLSHGPAPALIHGDLWSGNFLASDRGPALIDPAVYYGDREAEWAMMLLFGGFPDATLAAYQEAWPLPEGWRERIPIYQLYHVLNHFLLFGGGYGDQAARMAAKYA